MKHLFVPLELARLAKEKGFDEECYAYYDPNGSFDEFEYYDIERKNTTITSDYGGKKECTAPMYQQLIDWFDQQFVHISAEPVCIGSDEWEYQYKIVYLPKEHRQAKRRAQHLVTITSFQDAPSTYSGAWDTRTDALNVALSHAFSL